MYQWILILVYTCSVLAATDVARAQGPSPAAWLRSTSQTPIPGTDRYDVVLTWQQGVVNDAHPASTSYDVYRSMVGHGQKLDDYSLVGTITVDPLRSNYTFTDESVVRGAYYYYVKGRHEYESGEPSPLCMVLAPGAYCVNMSDSTLTFMTDPKTVIEPGSTYAYHAFARHRSARVQGFVRYALVSGPEGMSMDELTGQLTWSVPADLPAPVAVKIRAWSLDDENAHAYQEWGIRPVEPYEVMLGSTTSVQFDATDHVAMFPNPASTTIQIQLETGAPAMITVIDLAGQVVAEHHDADGDLAQVSVASIVAGRYAVLIQQHNVTKVSPLVVIH